MKNFLPLVVACLLLAGCNNAAKQQTEQKAFTDSVAQAAFDQGTQAQAQKQADANAAAAQAAQVKQDAQSLVDQLNSQLVDAKAALAQTAGQIQSARDEAAQASNFHLLRSHSDREADISAANTRVASLQLQEQQQAGVVNDLNSKLRDAQAKLASLQ